MTGAVLLPAGAYCARTASRRDPRYLALAIMPWVFAVQQACEGMVWIGLRRGDLDLARSASLGFLFFALVFWPCWLPFSVLKLASRRWAKGALGLVSLSALGIGLSVFLPMAMNPREWLRPAVLYHSIEYNFSMLPAYLRFPGVVWQIGYVAVVAAPLAAQGNRRLTAFSLMVVASAVLAHVAFAYAFISIWCAFAAALSAWLCFVFHGLDARGTSPARDVTVRAPA